jgi:hypothetical protein
MSTFKVGDMVVLKDNRHLPTGLQALYKSGRAVKITKLIGCLIYFKNGHDYKGNGWMTNRFELAPTNKDDGTNDTLGLSGTLIPEVIISIDKDGEVKETIMLPGPGKTEAMLFEMNRKYDERRMKNEKKDIHKDVEAAIDKYVEIAIRSAKRAAGVDVAKKAKEPTIAEVAMNVVDATLKTEEDRLRASLEGRIRKERAKQAAIKNGVRHLGGWWSATIDMTPLSLTALLAAVAGISALTASLIPLVY